MGLTGHGRYFLTREKYAHRFHCRSQPFQQTVIISFAPAEATPTRIKGQARNQAQRRHRRPLGQCRARLPNPERTPLQLIHPRHLVQHQVSPRHTGKNDTRSSAPDPLDGRKNVRLRIQGHEGHPFSSGFQIRQVRIDRPRPVLPLRGSHSRETAFHRLPQFPFPPGVSLRVHGNFMVVKRF